MPFGHGSPTAGSGSQVQIAPACIGPVQARLSSHSFSLVPASQTPPRVMSGVQTSAPSECGLLQYVPSLQTSVSLLHPPPLGIGCCLVASQVPVQHAIPQSVTTSHLPDPHSASLEQVPPPAIVPRTIAAHIAGFGPSAGAVVGRPIESVRSHVFAAI